MVRTFGASGGSETPIVHVDSINARHPNGLIQSDGYISHLHAQPDGMGTPQAHVEAIGSLRRERQRLAVARGLGGLHLVAASTLADLPPDVRDDQLRHFVALNQEEGGPNKVRLYDGTDPLEDIGIDADTKFDNVDLLRTENGGTAVYTERYLKLPDSPPEAREAYWPEGSPQADGYAELFIILGDRALSVGDSTNRFREMIGQS